MQMHSGNPHVKRTLISAWLLVCLRAFAIAQTPSLTGRWVLTQDFFGTPRNLPLQLEQNGTNLTGSLGGDKLEGTVSGSTIHFTSKSEHQDTYEVQGTLEGRVFTGTM